MILPIDHIHKTCLFSDIYSTGFVLSLTFYYVTQQAFYQGSVNKGLKIFQSLNLESVDSK